VGEGAERPGQSMKELRRPIRREGGLSSEGIKERKLKSKWEDEGGGIATTGGGGEISVRYGKTRGSTVDSPTPH